MATNIPEHEHVWSVSLPNPGQVQERCECGQAQWAQFKDEAPAVMVMMPDLSQPNGVYARLMTA